VSRSLAPLSCWVLVWAALAADPARAQATSRAPAKKPAAAPSTQKAGTKKVIRLDTLTVEGRIQKPEAFYVLPRSNLSFDELQKTESFVPQIEKSAQRDPF
jgi:hypothetical protein